MNRFTLIVSLMFGFLTVPAWGIEPLSTPVPVYDMSLAPALSLTASPVPTPPASGDFWDWVQAKADAGEVIPDFTSRPTASLGFEDMPLPEGGLLPFEEEEDAFLAPAKGPKPLLTLKELYQACALKESTPLGGVNQRYVSTPHLRNEKNEAIGRFVCRHFARALAECAERMGVPARIVGFNCDCNKRVAELEASAAKPERSEAAQKELRNEAQVLRRGLMWGGHAQVLVAVASSTDDRDKVEFTLVDGQGDKDFSLKDLKAEVVGSGKISDWKTKAMARRPFSVNGPGRAEFARRPQVGRFMCGNWKCEYNPTLYPIDRDYTPQGFFSVSNEGVLKTTGIGVVDPWEPAYKDPTRGEELIDVAARLGRRSTVKKTDFGDEGVCKYRLRSNGAQRCEYREKDDEEDDLSKRGPLNP